MKRAGSRNMCDCNDEEFVELPAIAEEAESEPQPIRILVVKKRK